MRVQTDVEPVPRRRYQPRPMPPGAPTGGTSPDQDGSQIGPSPRLNSWSGRPCSPGGRLNFIVKPVSQAPRARRGAWEIARRDDPGSNQLDVPNQDELRAVLAARHLNGCPSSTVYTEELLDERAIAAFAFGRKRKHLGRSRVCVTLRPSTPNYG
jgi:hypothetical protein